MNVDRSLRPSPVRVRTVFHPWGVEISMSSENHGTPEDDDPFAYLYRGEGTEGPAQGTAPQPGVPRTSYHQATQVGRTQYGQQQPPQSQPGYPPQPSLPHQDQPTARYGAPQQAPAPQYGAPQQRPGQQAPPAGGRAGARAASGGSGGRGVMIGTIAVVAAIAVVIVVVVTNSGSKKTPAASGAGVPAPSLPASSAPATASATPTPGGVAPADAATMTLSGGAKPNNNWSGALGAGGNFVDGMTTPGATVNWTVTAPAKGDYYLWIRFANATGKDSEVGVTVNQKPLSDQIKLKDYGSNGKWTSWFSTYRTITLNQGSNTVALSCMPGATCTFNLDQLALTPPTGGSGSRPSTWK